MRSLLMVLMFFFSLLLLGRPTWAGIKAGSFEACRPAKLNNQSFNDSFDSSNFVSKSKPLMLAKKKKAKKGKKAKDKKAFSDGKVLCINPNKAKLEELMILPLVDAKTAQAIIDNRPYKKAEDLIKVPEVGASKYNIFKHLIEIPNGGVTDK